jgi:hypothetical protein
MHGLNDALGASISILFNEVSVMIAKPWTTVVSFPHLQIELRKWFLLVHRRNTSANVSRDMPNRSSKQAYRYFSESPGSVGNPL